MLLSKATFNIICRAVLGERFDYSDPILIQRLQMLDENKAMITSTAALEVFPFLKYLPGDLFGFKNFLNNIKVLFAQMDEKIEFHR